MKNFDTGRVQNKLINQLDRKEKQLAFQRDRLFKFKLPEIHSSLAQALLMEKIIETDNAAAVSDLLMKGLRKMMKTNEFDFKYFIAPLRGLVSHANQMSLYLTQYILEVVLNDPNVIDVYGTDEEIYRAVNRVILKINQKFEETEKRILQQLSKNKSITPGSREYDVALDELIRKTLGDAQVSKTY